MSIEVSIKCLPACAVPSKRTRASLRFDGYARTCVLPHVCVKKGGGHARGNGRPVQAAPVETTKAERERGARCAFTRLGLRGFWGGERVGREEIESRERRGSRKSDPESVDCGALARLDQSSYSYPRNRAHVCACTSFIARRDDFWRISCNADDSGSRETVMIRDVGL